MGSNKMNSLTPLQVQVLKTIREFMEKHGCAPSYRYISDVVGTKYPQQVANCIDRLHARGYILKHPHGASYTILRDEQMRHGKFRWIPVANGFEATKGRPRRIECKEPVCGVYKVGGIEFKHVGRIVGYDDDGRAIIKSKDGCEMSFSDDEIRLHMGAR